MIAGDARARAATSAALAAAVAAAVVVPTMAIGGYTNASRLLFVALAGLALATAVFVYEGRAREMARRAPVVSLAVLAALAAASAAWSLSPAASLRWALVIVAYAAVAVAAGVLAHERRGVEALAALIAGTAVLAALFGLVGFALHDEPFAERIYGHWRPGGPFEYPPTLALLQVSALPALLHGMTCRRTLLSIAAAAGAAPAAGTIALSGSRWQLALGAAVLVLAPFLARRPRLLPAATLVAASGAAIYGAGTLPGLSGEMRLVAIVAVCAAACAAWAAIVRLARPTTSGARQGIARAAVAAVVLALAGVSIVSLTASTREIPGSVAHSRIDLWSTAAQTALARPLTGYGADTYKAASAEQEPTARARYAHNLPLEAWAELGLLGLVAVLALYATAARALWRARSTLAAALLGPAVLAFLATNLVDWPWHQAGAGALWAAALGAVVATRTSSIKENR